MKKYKCLKARIFYIDGYRNPKIEEKTATKLRYEDIYLIKIRREYIEVYNEICIRLINWNVINDILVYKHKPVVKVIESLREKYKETFRSWIRRLFRG